jgi:hypothetical protein
MPVLHLGVIDVPYSQARGAKAKRSNSTVTTGDVAGWLEDEYHVMEVFANVHGADIGDALARSVAGGLENLMMGGPVSNSVFGQAESAIHDQFQKFIDTKEMDGLGIPGVPTEAAQRGVSHRFKRPYARRAPRPSFVDTGLYRANFKAWIE